jgi:uncharacterized protein YqeY
VDERIVLDDAAIVGVVDKLIKQRKDSITAFQAPAAPIWSTRKAPSWLCCRPTCRQRLSADEITAAVGAIVADLGASGPGDMGKVMAAAKAQLAGKADMGAVSAAVKAALSK